MTAGDLNAMNAAILPVIRTSNPTRIVLFMGLKVGRRENGRLREVGIWCLQCACLWGLKYVV